MQRCSAPELGIHRGGAVGQSLLGILHWDSAICQAVLTPTLAALCPWRCPCPTAHPCLSFPTHVAVLGQPGPARVTIDSELYRQALIEQNHLAGTSWDLFPDCLHASPRRAPGEWGEHSGCSPLHTPSPPPRSMCTGQHPAWSLLGMGRGLCRDPPPCGAWRNPH